MLAGPPFPVSHVLFDVDGTLIDFVGGMRRALLATAERLSELTHTRVDPREVFAAREQIVTEPEWRDRRLAEVRVESLRRLLAARGVDDATVTEGVARFYLERRDRETAVYPDVRPALEELTGRGFMLVAASNGNMDLATFDLARYFALVQLAENAGVSKPDPRFFAQAIEAAGGEPAQALAVGDRLDNDVEPARVAGLRAGLLDRDGRAEGAGTAVLRVGALTEVAALVTLAAS